FQLEHALSTAAATWLHGSHAAVSRPKRFRRTTAAIAAFLALAIGGFVWVLWRPAPAGTATQMQVRSTPASSVQIIEERPTMIGERAAIVGEPAAIVGKRPEPKAVYRPSYAPRSIRRSPLDSHRRDRLRSESARLSLPPKF